MKKAIVFMADGFEEIEAVTLVDIMRRAGIEVNMCSINDSLPVKSAGGLKLEADTKLSDIDDFNAYDIVVTPGGMPGASNLRKNPKVVEVISSFYDKKDKLIASICAAPMVLAKAGVSNDIKGTCYPGFEHKAEFKEYQKTAVVMDKNVITSIGPATAFLLALKIVEVALGVEASDKLKDDTMMKYAVEALK